MARSRLRISIVLLVTLMAAPTPAASELARCLEERALPRVARVVAEPGGASVYVRVVEVEDGVPTAVSPIAGGAIELPELLERAGASSDDDPVWRISASERAVRLCAPVQLSQREIDAESRVVVAAGLNYAAHAEEAGGGEVFLFPKPVAPGAPYAAVAPPLGVTLLDYEVELAFVLLEDVDLRALPTREELLAQSAFFVANDLTDREPIIVHKAFTGPGTGFVEAKGQPGFMPTGPWLVRGTELFEALAACGADGLRLGLDVDEGDGFQPRQDATTAAMILDPLALLARLADEVSREGARSPMPVARGEVVRHYPLATPGTDGAGPYLPAGSIVLTGTPEGVALTAPEPIGVLARGALHLRSPFEQFRQEELARAAAGASSGYLVPGSRVRAHIDGLGSQIFHITEPGTPLPPDPCAAGTVGTTGTTNTTDREATDS